MERMLIWAYALYLGPKFVKWHLGLFWSIVSIIVLNLPSKMGHHAASTSLLCNVSPKRYRELKRFAEAWQISIAKPTKATGTSWIEHKINAMNIALENGFSWTMMNLRVFRNKSLNEPTSKLTHYKRVILTCRPKPLMHMFIHLNIFSFFS